MPYWVKQTDARRPQPLSVEVQFIKTKPWTIPVRRVVVANRRKSKA